jgi:hypothetical protein
MPRVRSLGVVAALAIVGCGGDGQEPVPVAEPPAPVVAETVEEQGPRNPFGLVDVSDPGGADVLAYAGVAPPLGQAGDENAASWCSKESVPHDSIDGEWESRWKLEDEPWTTGSATLRSVGDRVFIRYQDDNTYLIEARRQGDRLVGCYQRIDAEERWPWVGTIVSDDRIDGSFPGGRWDFRRAAPPQA